MGLGAENKQAVHAKAFTNTVCACLGQDVCQAIDVKGNKDGFADVFDIQDTVALSTLLQDKGISFAKYNDCTSFTEAKRVGRISDGLSVFAVGIAGAGAGAVVTSGIVWIIKELTKAPIGNQYVLAAAVIGLGAGFLYGAVKLNEAEAVQPSTNPGPAPTVAAKS